MKAGTNLEKMLAGGHFAVTAEAGPPKGTSPKVMQRKAETLRSCCDAVNVTDNQTAIVRMSSLAGCTLLKQNGVEPVMQMVTRDRNRIALQSDVLGAVALGIGNILCLTGDHMCFGNHPTARGVFDMDSIQLVRVLKTMRDEKKFISGEMGERMRATSPSNATTTTRSASVSTGKRSARWVTLIRGCWMTARFQVRRMCGSVRA
mgnify:CR=1 FL=1